MVVEWKINGRLMEYVGILMKYILEYSSLLINGRFMEY
jgi:hypothetical protein